MNKLILTTIAILITSLFVSCNTIDSGIEKIAKYNSIENALSARECDKALGALNRMGEQTGDALYYKLRASAYACKADFSVTDFFLNEISKMTTGGELLSSMSTFTMAQEMTDIDDLSYYYIGLAVDTLLYSAGEGPVTNDPSSVLRKSVFGNYLAADIDSFLLYLLLNKVGMSMAFFGNVDAAGEKGAGSIGVNECFFDYTTYGDADMNLILGSGSTGNCDATSSGHIDLQNVDLTIRLDRACELVTNFNNLIDVLSNIDLSEITDFDLSTFLGDIETVVSTFETTVITPKGYSPTLMSVKNTEQCVADYTGSEEQIAFYMLFVLETFHSR